MSELLYELKQFAPKSNYRCRLLSMYSATIALADDSCLEVMIDHGRKCQLERTAFYEIVLQSYLFLGFPRMLEAAKHLSVKWPSNIKGVELHEISPTESESWFNSGVELCQKVYADNYLPLKHKVESFAPEIFRWMIVEGYGKVLSRPGLTSIERELAVVSCLIVENRPTQLHSHIRGALNVGADVALVQQVVEDSRLFGGEGCEYAQCIIDGLKI